MFCNINNITGNNNKIFLFTFIDAIKYYFIFEKKDNYSYVQKYTAACCKFIFFA